MSRTRIGPNHQIKIPTHVFARLHLAVGDVLEVETRAGKLLLVPKNTSQRTKSADMTEREQKLLARAHRKMRRIRQDPVSSRGLTPEEADMAARAGLIAADERWWWTEDWQQGEREAEGDVRAGRTKAFESVKELINDLRGRRTLSSLNGSGATSQRFLSRSSGGWRNNLISWYATLDTPACASGG